MWFFDLCMLYSLFLYSDCRLGEHGSQVVVSLRCVLQVSGALYKFSYLFFPLVSLMALSSASEDLILICFLLKDDR